MSFGLAHAAMLAALAAVVLPILVHLLSRRRVVTVDWGAMMFLDPGRKARTRIRLAEILLMAARMAMLALVAIAAARPFVQPGPRQAALAATESTPAQAAGNAPRDLVFVIDGSASMGRKSEDGSTPRALALDWIRRFAPTLGPTDTVAVLDARDQPRRALEPPTSDRDRLSTTLESLPEPRGGSDLHAAIADAFRILESTRHPNRHVIVFTDDHRAAWRLDQPARWSLLRDLHARLPVPPRIWVVPLPVTLDPASADGAIEQIEVNRGLVPPGLPIEVAATIVNTGPAPMTRLVDLFRDGQPEPGAARRVGPIPAGGRSVVPFRVRFDARGTHLLSVRFADDPSDPQPANDEAFRPVEVVDALPVLLVDGEPGLEPLTGELDFLRAALSPRDDPSPLFQVSTVSAQALGASDLDGVRVVVLANITRLSTDQKAALSSFVGEGGGLLVLPGDRLDPAAANAELFQNGQGWLPARLLDFKVAEAPAPFLARPDPSTFIGPVFGPLGQGDDPPLGRAGLLQAWTLEPATGEPAATVLGRLSTGDPWAIERPWRRGRVLMLAGPLDAEGGTLPVNPDFVPLVHEIIQHLADPGTRHQPVPPGSSLTFELDPAPPPGLESVTLHTPTGAAVPRPIERGGGRAVVRFDHAIEPGLYRLDLPSPPSADYAVVLADPAEFDPAPLPADAIATLSADWPLTFLPADDAQPLTLSNRLSNTASNHPPRPLWRFLLLAALAGLTFELWLTRRLSHGAAVTQDD